MISVLLTDDHEVMRKAIAHLLKGDPEIQQLVEADSVSQTMGLASKLHPQVVVMEYTWVMKMSSHHHRPNPAWLVRAC